MTKYNLSLQEVIYNFSINNQGFIRTIILESTNRCFNCDFVNKQSYKREYCSRCGTDVGAIFESGVKYEHPQCTVCDTLSGKSIDGKYCTYCGKNKLDSFHEYNGKFIESKIIKGEYNNAK